VSLDSAKATVASNWPVADWKRRLNSSSPWLFEFVDESLVFVCVELVWSEFLGTDASPSSRFDVMCARWHLWLALNSRADLASDATTPSRPGRRLHPPLGEPLPEPIAGFGRLPLGERAVGVDKLIQTLPTSLDVTGHLRF
jgi:hypothetical protein